MHTTPDYGITYLFHDRRARAWTGLRTARSTGHASVERIMGRYFTADTVLKVGHEINGPVVVTSEALL